MGQVCLLCVVHDPNGRYIDIVQQAAEVLNAVYPDRYVAISDQTTERTVCALRDTGWTVQIVPKAGAANARRDVLQMGQQTNHFRFHYCDLDRILTWVLNHPDELAAVKTAIVDYDFIIFGRTQRAFATHPPSWQATEAITNHICSAELGQLVDVTAGSCGMTRPALESILHHSQAKVTDAEWPMIVHRIVAGSVGYRAVEGLEYLEDINGSMADEQDAKSWCTRLRLSYLISESVLTMRRE
ncbi:hypothetical protein JZ785_00615 [Alicyclobacillus curvatus]|nr:hypothetical protein JZ785_00615 [Alicyclobacillus curvatus]